MYPTKRIELVGVSQSSIAFVLLAAAGGWAAAAKAADVELPDTHAGRCAAAYIKTFNTGDDAAVRAFEKRYRAASSLKARSMEDRLELHHEMKQDWGHLTVRRVVVSEERGLTLYVDPSDWPGTLMFRFDFEKTEPYGLLGIYIEGPVNPAELAEDRAPLDAETRGKTVHAIIDSLNRSYVYPEVAKKMEGALHKHLADGRYDDLSVAPAFASKLTEDLQAISHDLHLTVHAGGLVTPTCLPAEPEEPDGRAQSDYGFKKVEVLPGNIGYLKFNMFLESDGAIQRAAEAMAALANCSALIFDLRDNVGGSPEMIKFLSSYIFDEPTHLNSFYNRLNDKTSETWTLAEVPGRRFGQGLPVYVLTSSRTGSAAEEFTYNLKHLKRATIVGEATVGAAHPVEEEDIIGLFRIRVPYARAYNPITKKNWEGVGVIPHIKTSYSEALNRAVELALAATSEHREVEDEYPTP